MKSYKVPNMREILKPRWSHKPGFGMSEPFVLHERESFQQSTAPNDKALLRKLSMKKGEKILSIASYYASWASEIAKLGIEVDYSDISKSMTRWAKREYGQLFGKYVASGYELIPKKEKEYDWTFTFEACGGGSGLPIACLRSLLNKKGAVLVYHVRARKNKKMMGNKPKTYPLTAKVLSKVYGASYKIKKVKIKSHKFEEPDKMIAHVVVIIKTNEKARRLALKDVNALIFNKFDLDTLKRLNAFSEAVKDFYIKKLKV